jgi:hypothetical protein
MSSEHAIDGDDQHAVDTHHVDIDKQVKIYITVFVSLMALTLITALPVLTHSNGFWIPEEHPAPAAATSGAAH